jgi:hypothetical protein
MNTSNKYDFIDNLIFQEGLRVEAIDVIPESDLLLVILNNKTVLHHRLSAYKRLKGLDKTILMNYKLIGEGVGIHWPTVDEDLSLKGFLEDFFKAVLKSHASAA